MNPAIGPLLTHDVETILRRARDSGATSATCSLDLGRTTCEVVIGADDWACGDARYPYPARIKERTIYHWDGSAFEPISRYDGALIKLVPTEWGAPTFEIDGIKMLPTARLSPFADAANKVAMIEPRGKRILDCCGGLGYFAACCLDGGATAIDSFEKNADVIWLRTLNPWSPRHDGSEPRLHLRHGDISAAIGTLPDAHYDAVLHDPPRFGIAGELYSLAFYQQLARVIRPRGRLFHYTGTPNRLTSGRDVPNEVATRLQRAGFATELRGDGVLAMRRAR